MSCPSTENAAERPIFPPPMRHALAASLPSRKHLQQLFRPSGFFFNCGRRRTFSHCSPLFFFGNGFPLPRDPFSGFSQRAVFFLAALSFFLRLSPLRSSVPFFVGFGVSCFAGFGSFSASATFRAPRPSATLGFFWTLAAVRSLLCRSCRFSFSGFFFFCFPPCRPPGSPPQPLPGPPPAIPDKPRVFNGAAVSSRVAFFFFVFSIAKTPAFEFHPAVISASPHPRRIRSL